MAAALGVHKRPKDAGLLHRGDEVVGGVESVSRSAEGVRGGSDRGAIPTSARHLAQARAKRASPLIT